MKTTAFIGLYLSAIAIGLGMSTFFSDIPLLERHQAQLFCCGGLAFLFSCVGLEDGKT